MSFGHHEPDWRVVPCRGCGERIASEEDLVRDTYHVGRSCCSWHPYHKCCFRAQTCVRHDWSVCAACREPIGAEDLHAGVLWLETSLGGHQPMPPPVALSW